MNRIGFIFDRTFVKGVSFGPPILGIAGHFRFLKVHKTSFIFILMSYGDQI
jgi:hypothetical protein